ncbi:type II toxin-antitoxin system prevent-host-death family antitoxin [Photorhabdus laumondii subsp. laumondii]|uniref:Antitoxin n=2 Tax=Photorhabdus laumondii subsp. laumondii TaxID=141679 RepID=Q7N280_PHOLL|nr:MULTISPECIES: type II toxin-antitoxin system prevent-host-death family antitoxin [Photorhabdus]AWK42904.1 prevent-host-death family protein [Photorhabdus laumondii subsp. laumondii]AXG43678.1 type II toxin-antitoxin system prevent-host-death family antitoxin [Photorhabdus laumondii subsp. laumondii]AXG48223.1 type II toxin-antitoxin system prevent-host-death family antitoxin [Photorhabdus laumondii subsp. laumondii]KTL61653.1 antitoxin YefM [Photorhabdus laumondii subsp. laumondii]MCC838516
MKVLTYSEAKQNLSETMTNVVNDCSPVIITRKNGESCILMSLTDVESLQETAYLMRSPTNANRLLESTSQLRTRKGKLKELDLD